MTSPPSGGSPSVRRRLWGALPTDEGLFVARALRQETVGGVILFGAAMVAVAWANSPWPDTYQAFRDLSVP